jgi:hypothetical protein
MEEEKLNYKVAYIPDPLCWTEAPDNNKTFISQRNRWMEQLKRSKPIEKWHSILNMVLWVY